jgi:hypothetical protein
MAFSYVTVGCNQSGYYDANYVKILKHQLYADY